MKKWIGVALIGIMFASSIAFAFIQAFGAAPPQAQEGAVQNQLPSQTVIDYRLSNAQFEDAMARGVTVVTYRYDRTCIACADERGLLEAVAQSQDFGGQVIIEEIVQDGPSSLEATSREGTEKAEKIDRDSVAEMLCRLVANPPLGCAVLLNQQQNG